VGQLNGQENQALLGQLLTDRIAVKPSVHQNQESHAQTVIVTEYKALRDEILKRLDFRYQLLNLILIVAGTFLTIGLQKDNPASILLIYPVLSLFLTASWAHNGVTILRIGEYIQERLAGDFGEFGWEAFYWKQEPLSVASGFLGKVASSGLIITTQILAIGLAVLKSNFTAIDIVLLICSLIAIVLTILALSLSFRHPSSLWSKKRQDGS